MKTFQKVRWQRALLWVLLLLPRLILWLLRQVVRLAIGFVRVSYRLAARALRAALRNWKPLLVMTSSLILLGIGFVRIQYDASMLRGAYADCAYERSQPHFGEEDDDDAVPPQFGQKNDLLDRLVVWAITSWRQTEDFIVGDRTPARFNLALKLYRQHDYRGAILVFDRTYAACAGSNGKLKDMYRHLGSVIQHLIGNAYDNQGKSGEAIEAYKLSLSLNPDELITIYDLERLLFNGGGQGGQDKGNNPKPGQSQNSRI